MLRSSSRRLGRFRGHWDQGSDGSSIFDQVLARNPLNVFCRDGSDAIEKLIDFAPARSDRLGLAQQHRVPEVRILFEYPTGFYLVLGPLELLLRRRFVLEALDFPVESVFDHLDLLSRAHQRIEVEKSGISLH